MVTAGVVKTAGLVIPEERDHPIGDAHGFLQPPWFQRRFVEGQKPVGQARIVLEVSQQFRLPVAPGPQQPAVGISHIVQQEAGVAPGCIQIVPSPQRRARFGEGAQHQAVP